MQTRTKYIEQLQEITHTITSLAEKAASDTRDAALALGGDEQARARVLEQADQTRRMQRSLETLCLDTMLLQQPLVAGDLRLVTGAFRVVGDLAHIDAMARDLALFSPASQSPTVTEAHTLFHTVSNQVAHMIAQSVIAFLNIDETLAQEVFVSDNTIDAAYHRVESLVIDGIRNQEEDAACLLEVMMQAKYFERMADDTERIARWVHFRQTGEHPLS